MNTSVLLSLVLVCAAFLVSSAAEARQIIGAYQKDSVGNVCVVTISTVTFGGVSRRFCCVNAPSNPLGVFVSNSIKDEGYVVFSNSIHVFNTATWTVSSIIHIDVPSYGVLADPAMDSCGHLYVLVRNYSRTAFATLSPTTGELSVQPLVVLPGGESNGAVVDANDLLWVSYSSSSLYTVDIRARTLKGITPYSLDIYIPSPAYLKYSRLVGSEPVYGGILTLYTTSQGLGVARIRAMDVVNTFPHKAVTAGYTLSGQYIPGNATGSGSVCGATSTMLARIEWDTKEYYLTPDSQQNIVAMSAF